jgi:hypothetical protein
MNDIKQEFWETIKVLDKNDVLKNTVLIGSWAEYIYEKSGLLKNFNANLKTRDIDFLIKNINKPKKGINLVEILESEGFETEIDYISGVFRFLKGKDLEIEFIVREIGKGQSETYDVPSFGIKAEGLRYTGILIDNSTAIEIKNIKLIIPTPQAYLLQKIIINYKRNKKAGKDYLSIENLLENIKESRSGYGKLINLYNSLSKKQKKIIDKFLNDNLLEL